MCVRVSVHTLTKVAVCFSHRETRRERERRKREIDDAKKDLDVAPNLENKGRISALKKRL